MIAAIVGLITGFLMVIPIGPVNLCVMSKVLNHRRWAGFCVGLGGALMDAVYLFVLMSGISTIVFNPTATSIAKMVGVLFLLIYGAYELFRKTSPPIAGIQSQFNPHRDFFLGIILYVSNPVLVATLSALVASIQAFHLFPEGWVSNVLFAVGAGVGSAGWYALLVWIMHSVKRYQTEKILTLANKGCGLAMILIAFYLGAVFLRDYYV